MMRMFLGLVAVFLLVACGGDGDSDNNPQNDNDTAGCSGCHAWETCVGTTCVFDSTSQWDVVAESGTVVGQNGSLPWDTFDDPDPLVCVTINGQEKCTEADIDTFYPDWHQKLFENAGGGSIMGGIYVEYWDLDITLADSEAICQGTITINSTYFNAGGVTLQCEDGVSTVSFTLTYQP